VTSTPLPPLAVETHWMEGVGRLRLATLLVLQCGLAAVLLLSTSPVSASRALLSTPSHVSSPASCTDELVLRQHWMKILASEDKFKRREGVKHAAKLLRLVFHDASDARCPSVSGPEPCNLSNLAKGRGPELDDTAPNTGVDFCLHTTFQFDEGDELDESDGDGNHNRGLQPTVHLVNNLAEEFTTWSKPDIAVLGAAVAVEALFNPQGKSEIDIGFKQGRQEGTCESTICTNDGCLDSQTWFLARSVQNLPNADKLKYGVMDATPNVDFFEYLGFNSREMMALQGGAHSLGGINRCTGVAPKFSDSICSKLTEEFLTPIKPEGCDDSWKCTRNLRQDTADRRRQTYFDSTPAELDTNYFVEMLEVHSDVIPTCRAMERTDPDYCSTDHDVCLAAKKPKRDILGKSTRIRYLNRVAKPPTGDEWRPMAYLSADWALLDKPDLRDMATDFASDEAALLAEFSTAFHKVTTFGYDEAADLATCSSVLCSPASGDQFSCGQMDFDCSGAALPVDTSACHLTRAVGVSGIIECGVGAEALQCPLSAAAS